MWRRTSVFDDLFDTFHQLDSTFHGPSQDERVRVPAVECFTRDKGLVLRAELPGIAPENLEVSVNGRLLTLRGEKKTTQEPGQGKVYFREIAHGRFERSFTLPENVKAEQLKASFTNGVLEITMPAESVPATRRVPIDAGQEATRKTVQAA